MEILWIIIIVDKIWNHLFMTRSLGLLSQPVGVP